MSGNGQDQIKIHVTDIDEGYAVFTVGEHAAGVDATWALSRAITEWFQEKGPSAVWNTLPIVRDGNTWAVHVWYE